ncbi:hypothetical protein U1Q18_038361 [Sarracenia purpurea var. burkii]
MPLSDDTAHRRRALHRPLRRPRTLRRPLLPSAVPTAPLPAATSPSRRTTPARMTTCTSASRSTSPSPACNSATALSLQ